MQHSKGLIAKLPQLRPPGDGRWCAIGTELRAPRQGSGLQREQSRTVNLRKPRPGAIRESNASKRQGQRSCKAHTACPREQAIHRRGIRVGQKESIGAPFTSRFGSECSERAGFYSCLQRWGHKQKGNSVLVGP